MRGRFSSRCCSGGFKDDQSARLTSGSTDEGVSQVLGWGTR